MNISPLKWDSDFFNLAIGKITNIPFDAIPNLPTINEFDLIYIEETKTKQPVDKLPNIKYTDTKTIYKKSLKKTEPFANEITIYTSKRMNKNLLALALQSAAFSRFKLDEKFKKNCYIKLYTEWIRSSVAKKTADIVLVFGKTQQPKGFITIVIKNNSAQIGLIAVDKEAQRQGIGKTLIDAASHYALKNNFTTLQVVTQSINTKACAFYERCGFKKQTEIYTHHYWNK